MSNFTPAWFKKGFFNESLFCDDFLSTHQLLYSNGAFFTPDGRMTDTMPLRCEIFEMMREYVGANLAKKVTNVVDAAHRLDTVLDKFLKTMQTTATRLQEKLLKPEARQKGKEQVKEKARDSVLQLLNRLQAEQAQNKPAAQPRTQEGHSEI